MDGIWNNTAERSADEAVADRFIGTSISATTGEKRAMAHRHVGMCKGCWKWQVIWPSLWGECRSCENERMSDVCAG